MSGLSAVFNPNTENLQVFGLSEAVKLWQVIRAISNYSNRYATASFANDPISGGRVLTLSGVRYHEGSIDMEGNPDPEYDATCLLWVISCDVTETWPEEIPLEVEPFWGDCDTFASRPEGWQLAQN